MWIYIHISIEVGCYRWGLVHPTHPICICLPIGVRSTLIQAATPPELRSSIVNHRHHRFTSCTQSAYAYPQACAQP